MKSAYLQSMYVFVFSVYEPTYIIYNLAKMLEINDIAGTQQSLVKCKYIPPSILPHCVSLLKRSVE